MHDQQVISEVLAAEHARCVATGSNDWESLEKIFADDFTYTHANGWEFDTKESYITSLKKKHRAVTRGEVKVRPYGDVAVTNGELFVHFPAQPDGTPAKVSEYAVLQVWVKHQENWQIVAYQSVHRQHRP